MNTKTITYDPALWQLVPKKPDAAMKKVLERRLGVDAYRCALVAAPSAPEQPKQEGLTDDKILDAVMAAGHHSLNSDCVLKVGRIVRALLASQPASDCRKYCQLDADQAAQWQDEATSLSTIDQLRRMGINYMTKAGSDELEDWIKVNTSSEAVQNAMCSAMQDCINNGTGAYKIWISDSGDAILAEHMAVIDSHRQKRQERRMQNMPVEVERREGWDRRARSEPMKY